jgi:hypothetical protein
VAIRRKTPLLLKTVELLNLTLVTLVVPAILVTAETLVTLVMLVMLVTLVMLVMLTLSNLRVNSTNLRRHNIMPPFFCLPLEQQAATGYNITCSERLNIFTPNGENKI